MKYKCQHCDYESKYRTTVLRHAERHKLEVLSARDKVGNRPAAAGSTSQNLTVGTKPLTFNKEFSDSTDGTTRRPRPIAIQIELIIGWCTPFKKPCTKGGHIRQNGTLKHKLL